MAKDKNGGSSYDTPEKATDRSDNKPMFPPPRKPTSKDDRGLMPVKGLGSGGLGANGKGGGSSGFYPRYRSAEALEFAVNEYFSRKESEEKPFTMAGLALSLGFKSAKALSAYELRGEEYADIVEVARTRVEEWKNELLLEGGRATNGVIFDLKNNHGWTDRIENKTTMEVGGTLTDLLASLQGTVLRPKLAHEVEDGIEEGVFTETLEGDVEKLVDENIGNPPVENYLDKIENLI